MRAAAAAAAARWAVDQADRLVLVLGLALVLAAAAVVVDPDALVEVADAEVDDAGT